MNMTPLLVGGEAVRALWRHKLRSTLTTLGITIGIAAVVLVAAVGRAGSRRAEEQLQNLGDNLVWVEAGSRTVTGLRSGTRGANTLTIDDMEAIRREVPLLKSVSPNIDGRVVVAHERLNWTTGYRGVYSSYLDIKRWPVAEGAPFTDEENDRAASVCLLGTTVRKSLFGEGNAVGEMVRIAGQPFEVVAVLAPKGQSATGTDQDDAVVLPYAAAQTKIRGKGVTGLDDILCSAVSAEAVDPAVAQILAIMRERHHIADGQDEDFNIRRPEEVIKAQLQTNQTFSLLLLTIASVSMLVGGIGIMNVMLASVAERTKEIGLRLSVGASQGAVQLQFLAEAVALSIFGGLLGVCASVAGATAFERLIGWQMTIPLQSVFPALGFAALVGVFFATTRRGARPSSTRSSHYIRSERRRAAGCALLKSFRAYFGNGAARLLQLHVCARHSLSWRAEVRIAPRNRCDAQCRLRRVGVSHVFSMYQLMFADRGRRRGGWTRTITAESGYHHDEDGRPRAAASFSSPPRVAPEGAER